MTRNFALRNGSTLIIEEELYQTTVRVGELAEAVQIRGLIVNPAGRTLSFVVLADPGIGREESTVRYHHIMEMPIRHAQGHSAPRALAFA